MAGRARKSGGRKAEIEVREVRPDISFLKNNAKKGPATRSATSKLVKQPKKRKVQAPAVLQQKLTKYMRKSVPKDDSRGQQEEENVFVSSDYESNENDESRNELPADNIEENKSDSEHEEGLSHAQSEIIQKRALFKIPTFWTKYFIYDGHVMVNGIAKSLVVMTCVLCNNNPELLGKSKQHRGAPWSNFTRHLQRVHPEEHRAEVIAGNLSGGPGSSKLLTSSIVGSKADELKGMFQANQWTKPTNDHAYDMSHPTQRKFVTDVMDLIAIDNFPLDTPERPMFIKLLRNCNPTLRMFSRRTLTRRFSSFYSKEFLPLLRSSMTDIQNLGCNIILDLWTDRQKSSILGVKAQFITANWKLRNTAVAFPHFEGQHSSQAIKRIFDDILKRTLDLKPEQVGFAVGDSASNMKSAFLESVDTNEMPADDDEVEGDGEEDEWVDYETFFQEDDEVFRAELLEESDITSPIHIEVPSWANRKVEKLPCFCHLLQLVIKDAIAKTPSISNLVENVNTVKAFFHRSNYWYDELKAMAGKGLISQASTRWGSVYYVLDRLTEKKMQEALNKILEKTRMTKTPCRVTFSIADYELMTGVAQMLRPLVEATNNLQADKVTLSMVIPQIAGAYECIREQDVGDNCDCLEFKQALLSCLEERFSTGALEKETRPLQISRLKRITRQEIFKEVKLILATLLDPRLKTAPFLDDENDRLNIGACSSEKATTILISALKSHNLDSAVASQPSVVVKPAAPGSLLKYLEKRMATTSTIATDTGSHAEECLGYLDKPATMVDMDPLDFWRTNASEFPRLAQLAKIYLAIPASSGSVERLFSIAGAIQRARRARLRWNTIENLLFGKHV